MTTSGMRGVDLFKIAGRSISGWIKSLKTGNPHHVRQPFCSQLEERLLMYLEYHPQVAKYSWAQIRSEFDSGKGKKVSCREKRSCHQKEEARMRGPKPSYPI